MYITQIINKLVNSNRAAEPNYLMHQNPSEMLKMMSLQRQILFLLHSQTRTPNPPVLMLIKNNTENLQEQFQKMH